jgi:rhodanese-related sulfurtransferase
MKKRIFRAAIFIAGFLIAVTTQGCMENTVNTGAAVDLENSALMLKYIESTGDFINSDAAPGLISATELFTDRARYVIIDIRPAQDFDKGYIAGAVNLSIGKLYSFTDSLFAARDTIKAILVCEDGQASAYFTCLLRVAGLKSVYCLKYGMASWNGFFAGIWLEAVNVNSDIVNSFVNDGYDKKEYTPLPSIHFTAASGSLEEKCKGRIQEIIAQGFEANVQHIMDMPHQIEDSNYIICYGRKSLYFGENNSFGHMPYTRLYRNFPFYEFRSVNYLQTLPLDKPIVVYSANGLLGASLTAYLRLLGYDARNLSFGANQMFHWRLLNRPDLIGDAFTMQDVMNYPYVKK